MQEPQKIYLSTWMHLAAFAICVVFVVSYFYLPEPDMNQDGASVRVWGFTLFVFLFVVPVGLWALYLAFTRNPVLIVGMDFVEIGSCIYPRRKCRIYGSDILDVKTHWVRLGGDQRSDLIFYVKRDAYTRLSRSKVWRKKDPRRRALYWDFSNAEIDPIDAVNLIVFRLSITSIRNILSNQ